MPPISPVVLAPQQQDVLELIIAGALDPAVGLGALGIDAPTGTDRVELRDQEGAPLAELGADGSLRSLGNPAARPFEQLYRSPTEVAGQDGAFLIVPIEAAPTESDLAAIADRSGIRPVILLALVGTGRPRGISGLALLRACQAVAGLVFKAQVVAVPLPRSVDANLDRMLREYVIDAYRPAGGEVWTPAPSEHPGAYPAEVTDLAEGAYPAEVAAIVAKENLDPAEQGLVVLFTGLSGSGKSTIARGVRNALLEAGDRRVTLLDGDLVRRNLSAGLGFSRADRDTNIRRIGWVAAEIAHHGGTALASPIAPFDATRQAVRDMVTAVGGAFLLVHVATPLAECERRDRKGLYARARAGEIAEFTGISSPYQPPGDADLDIDTTNLTVTEAIETVLDLLRRRRHVR